MNAVLINTRGRAYAVLLAGALGFAALSLLGSDTPTFDPWSWLSWGREILHGQLHFLYGPSWKPLPVIFTALFAPLGSAAPNLWLLIARAGLILSVFMMVRLSIRLILSYGPQRLYLPALVGGAIAVTAYLLGPLTLTNSWLGNSEGIATAAVLIAVELAVVGRHRVAFSVGLVPALDRPEIWAFWGVYGLWLMWRDRAARPWVPAAFLAVLLLWFIPQLLATGSLTSSISRAQFLHSPGISNAPCPLCRDLSKMAWKQLPERVIFVALSSLVVALGALTWTLRRGLRPSTAGPRARALMAWGLLGAGGFAWWFLIALEAEFGFSGSARYLLLGTGLIYLTGGIGYGLGAAAAADLVTARLSLRGPRAQALAALCAVIGAAAFMLVPSWAGQTRILHSPAKLSRGLDYQGQLRTDLESAIRRAGGARRLLRCGQILVEYFQSPMLSWYLDVPFARVSIPNASAPATGRPRQVAPGTWPRTVIQDAPVPSAARVPSDRTIATWERRAGHRYRVIPGRELTMYTDCAR